jgi:integrase/recombinase XerD
VDKIAPRFLKMRPRVKKLPKFLTISQVRRLIYAAANLRDRALIELYYSTGCRNSELRFVRIEKIDFRRRRFKVAGKRKERMVYFGAPAAKAIGRYIGTRRSGYLFQDIIPAQHGVLTHNAASWMGTWRDFRPGADYGKRRSKYLGSRKTMSRGEARIKLRRFLKNVDLTRPKPDRPLTRSTMRQIITQVARRAGLGPMGPKILRHSFGSHMVEGGINLLALQELMGHSYLSSTQVYVHLTNKAVVSNFKKAHPRFR